MSFNPRNPAKYKGTDKSITFFVSRDRSPTGADYRQPETGRLYTIGTVWQVAKSPTTGTEGDLWMLSKIVANIAYWVQVTSGVTPTGSMLTLSDTASTLVYPTVAGNIQLEGTSGQIDILSDAGNNKLVFSLPGGSGAVDSFAVPNGTTPVVPDATGLITITESAGVTITGGLNTYDVALDGAVVGQTITGDDATALSPTAGNWNVYGLSGSKTSGSGSTLTIKSPPFSQVGGSATSTLNTGEFVTAAVTRTLPASAGLIDGDLFIFVCTTASALVIQSVTAQKIRIGSLISAAAGTATSTAIGDSLTLRFNATDGFLYAVSSIGTWVLV